MTSMLEHALTYARMGLRIFPVYEAVDETVSPTRCACVSPEPHDNAGKHPRTLNGFKDATSDEDQIRQWWTSWPDASIGLATGEGSGVVVIDVDSGPGKVGEKSIDDFELYTCTLPPTRTSRTGGGGRHLFYRYPVGRSVGKRIGWLKHVDLFGEGGYVLLPPSPHASGRRYEWIDEMARVDLPAEVVRDLPVPGGSGGSGAGARDRWEQWEPVPTADILKGVPEGERDDKLFRACCSWMRKLKNPDEVWLLVQEAARNCTPPFPEEQARVKLAQALKYDYSDDGDRQLAAAEAVVAQREGSGEGGSAGREDEATEDPVGPRGEPDQRNLTDDGNALRLVDRYGEEVRYAEGLGWLRWDGRRWQRDQVLGIKECVRDTVESIYFEAVRERDDGDRRRAIRKWATKSEAGARLAECERIARSDARIVRRVEDFDQDPWLLNTGNQVVNLLTGDVRPPSRSDSFTKVTSVEYDPEARCPRWLAFLEKVLPHDDVREYLRRAIGYSLTGVIREKVFHLLLGGGNNGKTVFIETIKGVFGDYALATPSSLIVGRREGAIPNDIARLRGARYVIISETEPGAHLSSDILKQLTGGDTVTARFMRQEFFDFKPQCKLWLATNHPPVVSDFSEGMWERLRLVPFDVAIPKSEQIPMDRLVADLLREGPGILRWAIEGCIAWESHGLSEPPDVMMATIEYRVDQDTLRPFLDEWCVEEAGAVAVAGELYQAYLRWCAVTGNARPWAAQRFGRELKVRKFEAVRDGTRRMWRGLRLREVGERLGRDV